MVEDRHKRRDVGVEIDRAVAPQPVHRRSEAREHGHRADGHAGVERRPRDGVDGVEGRIEDVAPCRSVAADVRLRPFEVRRSRFGHDYFVLSALAAGGGV